SDLRGILVETARELGIPVRDGGTVVVINGPRFSTRAESRWFQDAGWDTINMTAYPEGYLARELELCYANISMVTDHDVGVEGAEPVTHETVLRVFDENNERLRELLFAVIPKIGAQPEDVCATALRGARSEPEPRSRAPPPPAPPKPPPTVRAPPNPGVSTRNPHRQASSRTVTGPCQLREKSARAGRPPGVRARAARASSRSGATSAPP